jgi:hypothetical protein
MKKPLLVLIFFAVGAVGFAQAPQDNADYWIDETGKFHQMIRWTRSNALYYDVEIEKRDTTGNWLPELVQRTERTTMELTLSPGYYRYRIKTYNVMERLSGTTAWIDLRVYSAKNPGASAPRAIEIPGNEAEFTLRLEGANLVDGAELYIVPDKPDAVPIKPLAMEYSFDDTWLIARFAAADVPKGRYDIVIVNPGGLSQTISRVPVKNVKPKPTPETSDPAEKGPFSLDNTKSWSIGLLGNVAIGGIEDIDYSDGTSLVLFGAALNYTFFEKYRNYGKFFWIPNSFFVELSFNAPHTYVERFHDDLSKIHKEADMTAFSFDIGALYKIRLGRSQRWILNAGMALGFGVSYYDGKQYLNTPYTVQEEGSGINPFLYPTIRTGFSYRITPAWTADIGLSLGGVIPLSTEEFSEDFQKPPTLNFSFGVSYRRPYR